MHRETDRTYYRDRAEDELERGREAANPVVGRAHFILAGFYFDRAFRGPDDGPPASAEQPTQIVTNHV